MKRSRSHIRIGSLDADLKAFFMLAIGMHGHAIAKECRMSISRVRRISKLTKVSARSWRNYATPLSHMALGWASNEFDICKGLASLLGPEVESDGLVIRLKK